VWDKISRITTEYSFYIIWIYQIWHNKHYLISSSTAIYSVIWTTFKIELEFLKCSNWWLLQLIFPHACHEIADNQYGLFMWNTNCHHHRRRRHHHHQRKGTDWLQTYVSITLRKMLLCQLKDAILSLHICIFYMLIFAYMKLTQLLVPNRVLCRNVIQKCSVLPE